MSIDPKWRFAISIVVTIAIGISQGTLVLTNAIPAAYIPMVAAWCGIIAFIGSAVNTTISGMGMSTQSRSSAAATPNTVAVQTNSPADMAKVAQAIATIPEVSKVTATATVAAATPSNKVVSS